MSVYSGAALALFVVGLGRMAFVWREQRWIRATAKKLYEARRAVYSEIPTKRRLQEGELLDARRALDSTSSVMPGFTLLADYVDAYPAESTFARNNDQPMRVLVDAAGTTVAQVFRPRGSDVVRIHLVTELADGRWLLTENNKNEPVGATQRPAGFSVEHVLKDASPASMISSHAQRLAEPVSELDPSSYGNGSRSVTIHSFEDFVASHERRWNAIRKHRRESGYLLRSDIRLAPGTRAEIGDRIYDEVCRLAAADAEEDHRERAKSQ